MKTNKRFVTEERQLFTEFLSSSSTTRCDDDSWHDVVPWSFDMQCHAHKGEWGNKAVEQLYTVSTLAYMTIPSTYMDTVGELSEVRSNIVFENSLEFAWADWTFIDREILGKVNEAMDQGMRDATGKVNQLCSPNRKLQTMLSCWTQRGWMHIRAMSGCRFRWRLGGESKSTSGRVYCAYSETKHLCLFRGYARQTAILRGSTEAETISLDAGLRMEGILFMDFMGHIDVLEPAAREDPQQWPTQRKAQGTIWTRCFLSGILDVATPVARISSIRTSLHVFEDNEVVINMFFWGRRAKYETRFQNPQSWSWLVVWSNQNTTNRLLVR